MTSNLQDWIAKHYGRGGCKFCDYKHLGYHHYMTHLQTEHPEKWDEFEIWAGIKRREK